jgi:O-antigen/teichoic acid export membrane protein
MSAAEDAAKLTGWPFGGRRLFNQLLLFAMRAMATASKFLLAIYTARYLGLADLGIYGLLVGATIIAPAVLGLGLTDWIARKIVDLPRAQALPLIASWLSLTLCLYLVLLPLVFAADILLGEPIPLDLVMIGAAILMLDNLGEQASGLLIARRRVFLAYSLAFLRIGFWPIPVMAIGLLYPQTRTLEFLLLGWLAMAGISWLIVLGLLLPEGRWRLARPQWRLLFRELPGSLVLYIKDVSSTISMFLDRFLISAFLGLELTGVYTLFWSITNVVHSLAVYGVIQAQLPSLIAAGQNPDRVEFRALERRLQIEIGTWALLLALGLAIATPFLVPFLGQPTVQEHMPIFWIVLGATLLRVAADGYGFVLLALNRDRAIAAIAVAGAVSSAVLNIAFTPLFGLVGAATAYAITSGGLFVARCFFSRPATFAVSEYAARTSPVRTGANAPPEISRSEQGGRQRRVA